MRKSGQSALYSGYIYDEPKTNWSDRNEVIKGLVEVDFNSKDKLSAGGIPIISDGKTGYIDASDNHSVIYGNSGAKKTLCVFMPTICTLAKAGESQVILDVKGEIYARTSNYLKKKGYKIIVLNFRDFNGDGYNPLHYPARLWREGDHDKAMKIVNDFCNALAKKQEEGRNDPYWAQTGKSFSNGVFHMMFDTYPDIDCINLLSLSDYMTEQITDKMKRYFADYDVTNAAIANLKAVLSEPEKTLMSTVSTASSFFQPFTQNDKLLKMLSHTTFELEDIANEKTAVYIITDDSTTTCNPIVGTFLSQLGSVLVDKAFHSENGKLKNRVNFILDEFCSFPIPNICEALATNRSRNIRYFLCIQSLAALSALYPHYESMLANCSTTIFLGTTEMELLKKISERCGETERTRHETKEPLISVPELMTLRKDWYSKEALYLNLSDAVRYCTILPAIEKYESFCGHGIATLPDIQHPNIKVYTFQNLVHDIVRDKAKRPFR